MLNDVSYSPKWRELFSSMYNGVIILDQHGNVLSLNSSARNFLTISSNEYIGKNIQDLFSHSEVLKELNSSQNFSSKKINLNGENYLAHRSFLEEGKQMIELVHIGSGIKDIKSPLLFERMGKIVEFSTDGIYVVNKEGITLLVNSAYEKVTGLDRDQLVGRSMNDLISSGLLDQSVSLLVLKKKKRISIIQRIRKEKDVIVTGNPVFDESGDIQMVVSSVRDVTQLNKMTHELTKAKNFSKMNNNRYTFSSHDSDETVLFQSDKMKQIIDKVKQIAPFPTSVLLYGPSGSGKEVITNLIHQHSDRTDKPFIKVNCGAIPDNLLESELFGYVKGAFTGAHQDGKMGLLELADNGTIFLDEVGELPLHLQVKLLRVLQERKIQRIGDTKERDLDIRIVSATNQNLKKLVEQGDFREDLYYRLQVVEISIPPLSERTEDIELLLEHFFSHYCELYHMDKVLPAQTKKILKDYHWPGNVRELKNLVESMIVSVPSQVIEPSDLPKHFINHSFSNSSLKSRVEQFEKEIVLDTIKKSSSIRNAAQLLDVHHTTLIKKLKKWEGGTSSD